MKNFLLSITLLLFSGFALGQDLAPLDHMILAPQTFTNSLEITIDQAYEEEAELSFYVAEYMETLGMVAPRVRWTVYMLDVLEHDTPALVKFWSAGNQWIVVFHFKYNYMAALTEMGKRVVVAHEVGHLTGRCMLLSTLSLQEICADLISAELTTPDAVLALLRFYKKQWPMNTILDERIAVLQNLLKIESLQPAPSLEKETEEE
jgi:hypothetical protein